MSKINPTRELTDRGFKRIADFDGPNDSHFSIWVRDGIPLMLQLFSEGGWDIWTLLDRSNNAGATLARVDAILAANENVDKEPYKLQYEEFWRGLVERPDGSINMDAVMRELHDFGMIIEGASQVYCHVTGGLISKPNTSPDAVCNVADERVEELIEDAIQEWAANTMGGANGS